MSVVDGVVGEASSSGPVGPKVDASDGAGSAGPAGPAGGESGRGSGGVLTPRMRLTLGVLLVAQFMLAVDFSIL
ncbi:hypothetical protein ACFYNX_30105, partial [Streptomyces sp. NPDC007872]